MSATNEKALDIKPGLVYVGVIDSTVPSYTRDEIEADTSKLLEYTTAIDLLTRYRVASVTDTQVTSDIGANLIKIETDDNGTIYTSTEPEISVTATYKEFEPQVFAKLVGNSVHNITGSLVSGATQATTSGAFAFNEFIKIENQNGDGSAITVNSVTGGTDGLLVANTDYYVGKNGNGEYGIFIIDSATITTMAQVFTIDYNYTPNAGVLNYLTREGQELPRLFVVIESLYSLGRKKKHYLADGAYQGQIVRQFLDVNRAGNVGESPFNVTVNRGGIYIARDEVAVAV